MPPLRLKDGNEYGRECGDNLRVRMPTRRLADGQEEHGGCTVTFKESS